MRDRDAGAVVVVDESGQAVGIVTERDLVYKVVATDDDQATARSVMSSPPITISLDDHLYQATALMTQRRCRRLVVVDDAGRLAGFLSMRDLLQFQGYEPRVILERLDTAADLTALRSVQQDIDRLAQRLLLGDVDSQTIAEVLTHFNDSLTRRVLALNQRRLADEGLDAPTAPFAWVSFGSEGRREQVLRGDQDNGMIVADSGDDDASLAYYRQLAAAVNQDLAACGFTLCDGGVMAREDRYFGPLATWLERVETMVHSFADGQPLRDLTIFLDCRLVSGDGRLVEQLWTRALRVLQAYPVAVRALAEDAATKGVALNFLGRLHYERDGNGRRGIDIKRTGMLPLVAAVKAIAIDQQVRATSTAGRIAALLELGALDRTAATDLLAADHLFLKLKLQSSLERAAAETDTPGQQPPPPGHFIYPQRWTDAERQNLRAALRSVGHLLDRLRFQYMIT